MVNAIEVAKCMGAKTLSMTGKSEGKMSELSDVTIKVPETHNYDSFTDHIKIRNAGIKYDACIFYGKI